MKTALPLYLVSRKAGAAAAFVGIFCITSNLQAQDAIPADLAAPNDSALSPHEVQILQGQPANTGVVSGQALAETPRRLNYSLSVNVRGVYDDNILLSTVNPVSDFYVSIEPVLSIGFGDPSGGTNNLSFTYRPGLFLFVNHSEEDTLQHLIHLSASHNFGRLSASLSQDVQILDGGDLNSLSDPTGHNANIDVSQRTRHNIFTTSLSDTYDLTGKLFLSNAFGFTVDEYPSTFIGSRDFHGNLFLNYNYGGKLTVGIGGTAGYNTVDQDSPDQTYEQANIRFSYLATGKITLSASGGAEFRQFGNNSRGTYLSPVYELSGSYQPFDGTSIGLSGSRRIDNSASLGGQDYTDTNIHLSITQRFLTRMTLGLAVGYENANYFSTIEGLNATRNDDYYYIQPSVDILIMRFWTAGAYYLYRKDSSSLLLFNFDDNQVGVRSTITF